MIEALLLELVEFVQEIKYSPPSSRGASEVPAGAPGSMAQREIRHAAVEVALFTLLRDVTSAFFFFPPPVGFD